ncbi:MULTISPECIES: hypothetical protein, partial [Pseudomonas syringae group]|uniref:hypothetical protein n=1 Tax=Pseudomonas syringae group TaxID=136849 RepID=UPI001E352808
TTLKNAENAELTVKATIKIASDGFLNGLIAHVNASNLGSSQIGRDHHSNGIFWIARMIASGV